MAIWSRRAWSVSNFNNGRLMSTGSPSSLLSSLLPVSVAVFVRTNGIGVVWSGEGGGGGGGGDDSRGSSSSSSSSSSRAMVLSGGVCGVCGVVGVVCGTEAIFVLDTLREVVMTPAIGTMDAISLVHRLRSILG
jgi:hypothetical protein